MNYLTLSELREEQLGTSPYASDEHRLEQYEAEYCRSHTKRLVMDSAEKIVNRYDPGDDLIPGGPYVTWAEYELAEELLAANERIKTLERKMLLLEQKINSQEKEND